MRLIDADALLYQLDKRRTYEVMDGRNKAYGKGVRDAMKDIDAAPTIDAIPVEWLRNEAKRQHDMGEWADADVIIWLIQTWQNEQEAQK